MVEVGQHVGASALQGSPELGQLFRPGGNCGAQGVDDRGHHGLSAAPIRVGIGGDDPLVDAPGHGDRDVAAVGEHRSTVIVGECSVFTSREYKQDPLSVQALPGRELGLRVEFDTDVFDAASIEALIERLRRVLVAMTADSGRQS
jgi:hypothetical protein